MSSLQHLLRFIPGTWLVCLHCLHSSVATVLCMTDVITGFTEKVHLSVNDFQSLTQSKLLEKSKKKSANRCKKQYLNSIKEC